MKKIENKKNKILSLEMQITINKYMYESKIIDDKIYQYIQNRLIKNITNEKKYLTEELGMDSMIIDATKLLN